MGRPGHLNADELRSRLTAAFKVEYATRQADRPPGLTASSVGGCSSYAARKILGQPERTSGDVWRSLRGIALHDFVLDLLALHDPGFEDGRKGRFTWDNARLPVTGELDFAVDGVCVELKFRDRDTCRFHADHGAKPQEAMQVAVAAVAKGCTEAFVVHMPTNGGLEEMAVSVVDVAHWHREALAWLERVDVRSEVAGLVERGIPRRDAERRVLDTVPREMPLSWCNLFCSFRQDCRGDYAPPVEMEIPDPTMRTAAQEAEYWRRIRLEAEKKEAAAKAILRHVEGTVHTDGDEHLRVSQQAVAPTPKRRGYVATKVERREG